MRRHILALLLIALMTPFASETTELVLRMTGREAVAQHHVPGAPDHGAPDCEHGCSGLFHACGCHSNSSSTAATDVAASFAQPPLVNPVAPSTQLSWYGRGTEPPPLRPPIA